jgi:K+-transporting ATPase ATPase C chain
MRRNLTIACPYTVATTIMFGLVYPLIVTGLAQLLFKEKANGQLITRDGQLVGSRLIGQSFSSARYFHSRPSAAGNGHDAANSSGSNYGPTNQKLVDRIKGDALVAQTDQPGTDVPIDLVTASASGLDPQISPASADYQVARVAKARGMSKDTVRALVAKNTERRQLGLLGEPRTNVLQLNLDLDEAQTHTVR